MITFTARIQKFDNKGEKTGWSYIEVTASQSEKINPGQKVSYRVKGKIDSFPIQRVSLLPMGDGNFIIPFNASLRKGTEKKAGDTVKVELAYDPREIKVPSDFVTCLNDDPVAFDFFNSLPKGHQNYFSKWIDSAKTTATKTKRITMAVMALALKQGFGEMIRANKTKRD